MNLRSVLRRLYLRSPAENIQFIRSSLDRAQPAARNDLLDPLLALKSFPDILAWCIRRIAAPNIVLAGDAKQLAGWEMDRRLSDKAVSIQEWNWHQGLQFSGSSATQETHFIVCRPPSMQEHWSVIAKANAAPALSRQISTLGELVAPFTQITTLMTRLDYFLSSPDEAFPIYLGKEFFGPLKELNALLPLDGKRVIEFGSFDGYQSLGLSHLGAELTCIEARGDNVAKTRAALDAFGYRNARILMDDFHNCHGNKYGRFDLAFAHGVYYHSVAPFVFLQNLVSLSDNIFLGGFCATDDLPATPWITLRHDGHAYRAKIYAEATGFTAGINDHGYFFHKDDLKSFLVQRGFRILPVSDEASAVTAGNFSRFLAQH